MSFGGPFGYGGMMPPAQSGGLDHYDPNEYKYRPPYTHAPKTPMDIYEKKEDQKTLGTILSTIFVALGALVFVHHVQALRSGGGFGSVFSPHSRQGKKDASRILQNRLDTAAGKRQVEKIDKYYKILKNKNSSIESRLEARDRLHTLIYSNDGGLGRNRHDPALTFNPPKNWFTRSMPWNWTAQRVTHGSILHKFTQSPDVITVQKAHKLLNSRSIKRLQNKDAAAIGKTSSFGSEDTFVDSAVSSANSSASTVVEKLLLPDMTHKIDINAQKAVLHDRIFLKKAGTASIQEHFESHATLEKGNKDKKELKSVLEKRHKTFNEEFKPYNEHRKHVDSIESLTKNTDNANETLKQIHEKATDQLKTLKADKESHQAQIKFYEKIQKLAKVRNEHPDTNRAPAFENIEKQVRQWQGEEKAAHDKIKLNEAMIAKLKES